jgi:uncharacterized protein YyaL (SSP411 family)
VRLLLVAALALSACKPKAPAPSTTASQFRFSPRPNRAAEIHWRAWDPSVFADAQRTGRPILLSLAAIWCHWCHVLDETTLSDPRVIATLNRDFIPVRVDADQHPDIERRYILGGWPTVAVLTARGEIVDGGTYVPPDAFVQLLSTARETIQAGGPALETKLAQHRLRFNPAQPAPLDASIVDGVTRNLISAADPVNGGFGGQQKFPQGAAVELLLDVGETDLARRALDAMLRLEDPVEHGFYRYATRPDWSAPHYEKMLSTNAELLSAYAHGFASTKDPRYRDAALRTAAWMEKTLLDGATGALWASQDADEHYYSLGADARALQKAPYIDRTLLADRAARAAVALADAADALAAPQLRATAARALDGVLALRGSDGRVQHCAGVKGQLADQAWTALALARLGRADDARKLLAASASLRGENGAWYDADPDPLGYLRTRDQPLEPNAALALAQLAVSDKPGAQKTLEAFTGVYLFHGFDAALYARAVNATIGK